MKNSARNPRKPAQGRGKLALLVAVLGSLLCVSAAHAGGNVSAGLQTPSKITKPKYPTLGPAGAKVTIEIFGDFQCPWTKRFAPLVPQIGAAYPRKVKLVWRDFPLKFHRQAMPAAIAGREVYQQRGLKVFLKFAQSVFMNARSITDASLVSWASAAGADGLKVSAALSMQKYRPAIQAEMKAAQRRGVRGTPTILINGAPFKGPRTLAGFRQVIDGL